MWSALVMLYIRQLIFLFLYVEHPLKLERCPKTPVKHWRVSDAFGASFVQNQIMHYYCKNTRNLRIIVTKYYATSSQQKKVKTVKFVHDVCEVTFGICLMCTSNCNNVMQSKLLSVLNRFRDGSQNGYLVWPT